MAMAQSTTPVSATNTILDKDTLSLSLAQPHLFYMLHVTEFLAATMDQTLFLRDNYLRTAFKMIDSDHSGKISWAELRALLGGEEFLDIYSQDQLERAIREVDENGDGEVDFQEFKAMMQSISQ